MKMKLQATTILSGGFMKRFSASFFMLRRKTFRNNICGACVLHTAARDVSCKLLFAPEQQLNVWSNF